MMVRRSQNVRLETKDTGSLVREPVVWNDRRDHEAYRAI